MEILEQFYDQAKIPAYPEMDDTLFRMANKQQTPLVLTRSMSAWKAYLKWDLNYFKEDFGTYKISADRLNQAGQAEYIYLSLSDFIDYARTTTDPIPYYGKTNLHLSTGLKNAYSVPSQFQCWYKSYAAEESKIDLSCLYFGPPLASSPLHQDIWGTSFWNALFEGKKLWLFYPEEQTDLLYGGQVNPFAPDLKKHPRFRDAQPQVWLQRAGELIFSPGKVWHAVLTVEPCLALSENFINATNYQNVLAHFQLHKHRRAYEKMKKIAAIHQYA